LFGSNYHQIDFILFYIRSDGFKIFEIDTQSDAVWCKPTVAWKNPDGSQLRALRKLPEERVFSPA
jgi:hypothetical protein